MCIRDSRSRIRSTTLSPFHTRTSATAARTASAARSGLRSAKLFLAELQDRDLVAAQGRAASALGALARRHLGQGHRAPLEVGLDQCRVDVVLAAHRARVAEAVGHEVDGLSLIHISEPTRLLSISYAVF